MSVIRGPQTEWARLNEMERRLSALERTSAIQGGSMSAQDGNGVVRLKVGQLSVGVWGIQVFDASGNDLVVLDTAGLRLYDAAGHELINVGKLHGSPDIYGLAVAPATGSAPTTLQQVGGAVVGAPVSEQPTPVASSWTAFSPSGAVTAAIGPSGQALISVNGNLTTAGSTAYVTVGVSIDGANPADGSPGIEMQSASAINTVTLSDTVLVSGLSPGTHTFAPVFQSSSTGNKIFDAAVTVQPH